MLRISSLALVFLTVPLLGQAATPDSAVLLQQATAAYQEKHFNESVNLYARVLPLIQEEDARTDVELDLARAQAQAGERAAAFNTLDHAVDDGYINHTSTEADPDLVSLHADPRWQSLLARMTKAAAAQDARWGDAAFATPYAVNISDTEKLAGLSELWAQAKYGFANFWHVPQLNWDQTYRDYIPKVLATHSTADYYLVLESFYALLKDGHTGVFPSHEIGDKFDNLPFWTRLTDGQVLIRGSRYPGADLQGLHVGDEIVTINSEPVNVWAERNVAPFVFSSSLEYRNNLIYGYDLFLAPDGTVFTLGTQTPTGNKSTHVFIVNEPIPDTTSHISQSVDNISEYFELNFLPGNIAYIKLNGFGNDTAAKEWDKHWPEISKAKSLILDVRENGGGDDGVGFHILATLFDKPVLGASACSTRWIASNRPWGKAEVNLCFPADTIEPDPARHFSGPVTLLTSPRTFSAAEDMTVVFAQALRGKIIGEPTGGSTGQPLNFKLPGGGFARVCTKHDSFADGREFVGVGVPPDVPVHLTRADVLAGRDPVLETAVHSLQPENTE
jgi:carboxyl-terminal processing protease